jgi:hypothetical protein
MSLRSTGSFCIQLTIGDRFNLGELRQPCLSIAASQVEMQVAALAEILGRSRPEYQISARRLDMTRNIQLSDLNLGAGASVMPGARWMRPHRQSECPGHASRDGLYFPGATDQPNGTVDERSRSAVFWNHDLRQYKYRVLFLSALFTALLPLNSPNPALAPLQLRWPQPEEGKDSTNN